MKKIWIIIVVVLVVVISLVIVPTTRNRQSNEQLPVSPTVSPAQTSQLANLADLNLANYEGRNVGLADFAGQPLIINSWAAWCPFCGQELKDFAALQEELGNQATVIAINRAESLAQAKKYTDDLGVTNDLLFLLDPNDSFYQAIGAFSMPETIFLDRNGQIVFHKRGPMDLEEMRQRAKSILQQ